MERYVSASEARQRFLKLLDEALEGDQIVVTRHGTPAAVMIDFEELQTLKELARLWQDPDALRAMREATEDVTAGRILRTRTPPRTRELLKRARDKGLMRG